MSALPPKIEFLRRPRSRWVDMHVSVSGLQDGKLTVQAVHTDWRGQVVARFRTVWDEPEKLNTEYGHGLSIIHDAKDHIFYGIHFTPLTEIQTIVQSYYGRDLSGGRIQRAAKGEYITAIREQIFHELFAPEGRPLVYDREGQRGLIDIFAPQTSQEEQEEAFFHLSTIAEQCMLPAFQEAYPRNTPLRELQASTRDQPELIAELLPGLRWADRPNLLLRLDENMGFETRLRAYIDDELAELSRGIRDRIRVYAQEHRLTERFGRIFETGDYLLT
jgi:hypothetical protein